MTPDWLTLTEEICVHCGGRCCIDAYPPLSAHGYRRMLAGGIPPDRGAADPKSGKDSRGVP